MKNEETKLSIIKSKDIVKVIFSNIQTVHLLKLIKYNKNIQNRLNIKKEAYENNSDLPKLELGKETKYHKLIKKNKKKLLQFGADFSAIILSTVCYIVCFLYILIYTILLVALDGFDGSNSKEDSEDSIKIIDIINLCLFALVAILIASYFVFYFFIWKNIKDDINWKRVVKIILFILIIFLHATFEGLIIWKVVLSYSIKKDDMTWFMRMDITFLVFNFILIAFLIYNLCVYKNETKPIIEIKTIVSLKSINNIKINKFSLPLNFSDFNRKEKRKFIQINMHSISIIRDPNESNIIKCINDKRKELGIKNLTIYNYRLLPVMGLLPSEAYFFEYKTVFQIGYNIFLIWCTFEELEKKIKNGDEDIIKVLKNDKLNYINIINRHTDNKSYIYIWDIMRDNYKIKNPANYKFDNYYYKNSNEDKETKVMLELKNDFEVNLIDK